MNRRNLIKTLGLSAVGLATVPLWMEGWTAEGLPVTDSGVNDEQKRVLTQLVGVIIPATDTPGAKELKVDKFILTMVANCYEKEVQDKFLAGFDELDKASQEQYGSNFVEISDDQQEAVSEYMLSIETPEGQGPNFLSFVKGLCISGYMSSEYVMQNITKYEFIPSRFNGSFPVDQTISKKA